MTISRNGIPTEAFQNLVTRAYLADPVRTDNELRELGFSYFAAQLKIDHQLGRLQANAEVLEPTGITCDFCHGPIPPGGEGYPEICPGCIRKEEAAEQAASKPGG